MRLLRERNLPPKVVDLVSFAQGELQLVMHTRINRQSPQRVASTPMMISATGDTLRSVPPIAVVVPVIVAPRPHHPVPESPRRIINLRKRKGNEERENHQLRRGEKRRKISLPNLRPSQQAHQRRIQNLKRELRPRR